MKTFLKNNLQSDFGWSVYVYWHLWAFPMKVRDKKTGHWNLGREPISLLPT